MRDVAVSPGVGPEVLGYHITVKEEVLHAEPALVEYQLDGVVVLLAICLLVLGYLHLVPRPGMTPHSGQVNRFLTNLTLGQNHVLHVITLPGLQDLLLVRSLVFNH